jgi:hypothetical protein
LPGLSGADVNFSILHHWVKEALRLAVEADRAKIGAQYVGKLLAHSPSDPSDGGWPHRSVRAVIEDIASEELERGVSIERFNMRGVYSKDPYDGGSAERALAAESRRWALTAAAWPRTAAMLNRISENWDSQATREDIDAQQRLLED